MSAILSLEAVSKTYRSRDHHSVTALNDVNLQLNAGELKFVCGSSGSGKSTLLLCAGGLLSPDRGSVKLEEQDIYALSGEERSLLRARRIGFVFQQFHLIPYLNVLDNVLAPALAGYNGDPRPKAEAMIERFGIADRRSHSPAELSIGERQRVALARALIFEPVLLLADEPTGNLDEENSSQVMACLHEFAEQGGAVMVVTHDPRHRDDDAWLLNKGTLKATRSADSGAGNAP